MFAWHAIDCDWTNFRFVSLFWCNCWKVKVKQNERLREFYKLFCFVNSSTDKLMTFKRPIKRKCICFSSIRLHARKSHRHIELFIKINTRLRHSWNDQFCFIRIRLHNQNEILCFWYSELAKPFHYRSNLIEKRSLCRRKRDVDDVEMGNNYEFGLIRLLN